MSEEISYSNYLYQGQVYSPAFSDPPSPSSPMSTSSDTGTSSIQSEIQHSEDQSTLSTNMSPVYTEENSSSSSHESTDNKRLPFTSSKLSDNSGLKCNANKSSCNESEDDNSSSLSNQNTFSNTQVRSSRLKFPTKYHEMLQPLSPVTTLPVEEVIRRPLPNKTHITEHDLQLQKQFHSLVDNATTCQVSKTTTANNENTFLSSRVNSLEDFLVHHSENIDVNQYNSDGQTALQQCCLAGNLPLVKLLVRFGANMRLTTREGFSILHIAAFSGHSDLLTFVLGHNNER
jgi:hypothetical protein